MVFKFIINPCSKIDRIREKYKKHIKCVGSWNSKQLSFKNPNVHNGLLHVTFIYVQLMLNHL